MVRAKSRFCFSGLSSFSGLSNSGLMFRRLLHAHCLVGSLVAGGMLMSPPASAQQVMAMQTPVASVNTYFCPKCGQYHSRSTAAAQSANAPMASSQPQVIQASGSSLRASSGGISNVLMALNAQRSRQGLAGLSPDGQLQAVAEQRAQLMASRSIKSHPPGSFSPGRYEGVGWSSSYSPSGVSACFTSDPNMRVAGAAMATGRDGVYFCVVYR